MKKKKMAGCGGNSTGLTNKQSPQGGTERGFAGPKVKIPEPLFPGVGGWGLGPWLQMTSAYYDMFLPFVI